MTGLEIAIGVVLIILSVVIIAVILLQEGRQANLAIRRQRIIFGQGKARTRRHTVEMDQDYSFSFFILVFIDADYQVFRSLIENALLD